MDCLESHWSLVDYKEKIVSFLNESRQRKEIQGIKKNIKLHHITPNQLGKCIRKGYQIYAIQVGYTNSKDKMTSLEDITVIQEFVDVFPECILRLPTKLDIDFTIELVLGVVPISRNPYCMSIPKLIELKMQLQDLLDKGCIHPSVSPWGSLVLFV